MSETGVGIVEQEAAPEKYIGELVARAEKPYESLGAARKPGERFGVCGVTSDLVRRSGENAGFDVKSFQIANVHKALGVASDSEAFTHGFNVVSVDGAPFLVDISFCQFIDPQTGEIHQFNAVKTGVKYGESPVAKELLEKGYVELNDETYREYLRITSSSSDKRYIQNATVENLVSPTSGLTIDYDHSLKWLDKSLDEGRFA